jgi:4-amino-4-deoxy-L-arabinose transferase-like glycosyltransferase
MGTNSAQQKWLALILAAAVISHVVAAFALGDKVVDLPGTFDQASYHNLAIRVLTGHGFSFGETWWPITPAGAPTAHWSFLYTFFLVAVYALFGVHPMVARLIQAVATGLVQPYLAYRIGNTLFSKSVGLVSAALTAVYVYFIYYDAALMTEPFFLTLVTGSLYLAIVIAQNSTGTKEDNAVRSAIGLSLLLGLILGSAVLLRQLILLFVPVMFLWLWWVRRKQNLKLTLASFFVVSLVIVLMILPFSIYNTSRFGHFVLLNSNSGYAFFWANHPIYGTHFQAILSGTSYQSLIPVELSHLDEAALDQALLRRGLQFILDDPVRYILLSISRIPVFFMFWPSDDSGLISNLSRVASFGILLPFMVYGLYRSAADKKMPIADRLASPSSLLVIFAFVYTLIHLLSWALVRYRLPVDAVLVVFAGLGLVDLAQKIRIWRSAPAQASSHVIAGDPEALK